MGARRPRASSGGRGRGLSRGPRALPLGGGLRLPTLPPLSSSAHSPPACAFGRGCEAAPCTGCGLPSGGGGGGGGSREPPPRGPRLTQALPPPSPSGQHCGCHRRCTHTALGRRRVPPPGVVCARLRRAGAGSPIGRDPRGSRREQAAKGAGSRGVRVLLCPPPRVAVPSGGGGASPRLRGGGGSALLRPAGRGGSGRGGEGGPLRRPPPPCPVGCQPAILCLRGTPPG